MSQTGIFYGSMTGNTENAAHLIRNALGAEKTVLYNIAGCSPEHFVPFDFLILGTSTWGCGDLQDDWAGFPIERVDFTGKTVALFGVGDQESYPDTFVDGMGLLYRMATVGSTRIIGATPRDGYVNRGSLAIVNGEFVGLPLDYDNQSDLTGKRIIEWVELLNRVR